MSSQASLADARQPSAPENLNGTETADTLFRFILGVFVAIAPGKGPRSAPRRQSVRLWMFWACSRCKLLTADEPGRCPVRLAHSRPTA